MSIADGEIERRDGQATLKIYRHDGRWHWRVSMLNDDGSFRCSIESWRHYQNALDAMMACDEAWAHQRILEMQHAIREKSG